MGGLIGLLALVALVAWLVAGRRARAAPSPEDAVDAELDEAELAAAERELADDPGARPLTDGVDQDDDWGPGAPR